MESLIEKLKSLGVSIGEKNLEINPPEKFSLETIIKGEWLYDSLGDVYKVHKLFPPGYTHGRFNLAPDFPVCKVLKMSSIQEASIQLQDILFMDTETTGLSGGTGTMAFLVGLGYFSITGFNVDQFFLVDPIDEMGLLSTLSNQVRKFKLMISFNGTSFDMPLLKTRFLLNRMNSPLSDLAHLDLLYLSRKIWGLHLQSLKLRDLENEILGFTREGDEVPGWMVPQVYFDFVRSRDARLLKGVIYHNCMDVLSLAFIFSYVCDLFLDPIENEKVSQLEILSIARLIEKSGYIEESNLLYQFTFQNGLLENLSAKTLFHFGLVCKQQNHLEIALEFWKKAFEKGDYLAAIEISKYYEHHTKDYQNAKFWAQSSLDLINRDNFNNNVENCHKQKTINRLIRIEDKILKKI